MWYVCEIFGDKYYGMSYIDDGFDEFGNDKMSEMMPTETAAKIAKIIQEHNLQESGGKNEAEN